MFSPEPGLRNSSSSGQFFDIKASVDGVCRLRFSDETPATTIFPCQRLRYLVRCPTHSREPNADLIHFLPPPPPVLTELIAATPALPL